jgi:small subunit ribosomal protein S5e
MAPFRRVNYAIYLLVTGAREAAFRNIKTIAECLADEFINAAKGSSNSYAIKKKDEIERVAKANR